MLLSSETCECANVVIVVLEVIVVKSSVRQGSARIGIGHRGHNRTTHPSLHQTPHSQIISLVHLPLPHTRIPIPILATQVLLAFTRLHIRDNQVT